ncbi:MAG TPA: flagella basal body P-ring formation protein FlgA [Polyangiaceae bacterium]|nr:flagella basal body P-ring formation protein FlgA [Polyangiaceae bacterium]
MSTLSRFGARLVSVALAAVCTTARAEGPLTVSGSRVELSELCPNVPDAIRNVDLGPAPPPGSTTLLDRDRVVAALTAAGVDAKSVALPKLLRVVGASKRWTPVEVTTFTRGSVEAALPSGVTLTHLEAKLPLVAAPDAVAGHAEIPRLPKKAGVFRTTAVVPIIADGAVAARVTLSATLEISESAAKPDVARGGRVTLVIDRRSARVGAAGIALNDIDVGDVTEFRVDKTGRIVKARLDAPDLASVVSP